MSNKHQHIFAEDMSDEMCQFALETSQEAFQLTITKGQVFTTIASCIRKAFEKSYGRGWNVVVGRSFGAYVTHEIKTYMYFTVVPGVYVLLWRWVVMSVCRRSCLVASIWYPLDAPGAMPQRGISVPRKKIHEKKSKYIFPC
ncbi:Dynein light chain [Ectocarpus siliculosus]|uniref:Dynein light chain n=1 Tax=Ectocarpus siliculosus TaxID=2880 RepID=D7FQ30_ECTSI|nr:Dynein light chain [Ectocarpus siliculosus]|eukprot:CBJ48362.1 Dynein light chain [Ectocarpus siliculosus]